MDQKRDELLFSNVKGKNPFRTCACARRSTRRSTSRHQDVVMRRRPVPGVDGRPGINGFHADQNKRLPTTPGAEEAAGRGRLPERASRSMNCPNDRYVNDGRFASRSPPTSRASASRSTCRRDEGHLLPEDPAAATPAFTARLDAFPPTTRTTRSMPDGAADDKAVACSTWGSYSNPKVDELTLKIQSETDKSKRNAMIRRGQPASRRRRRPPAAAPAGAGRGHEQERRLVQLPDNFMFRW